MKNEIFNQKLIENILKYTVNNYEVIKRFLNLQQLGDLTLKNGVYDIVQSFLVDCITILIAVTETGIYEIS